MKALVTCLVLVTLACGKKEVEKPPAVAVDLALAADPGTAPSVKQAKEEGRGEEAVVVGRISNIVKGLATFNLVDESLPRCGPGNMPDCKTPWDYCCELADVRAAATLTVEARGPDGRTLAGAMPTLRLLDLVAVKGRIEKDKHGNVTVVANGWFRRERPDLPEGLIWPE
jgi:hypothetical protein